MILHTLHTVSRFRRGALLLLLATLSFTACSQQAHAVEYLSCEGSTVAFETDLNPSWGVEDHDGGGIVWEPLADCGLSNFTGGTGSAYCVNAPGDKIFDTSLETEPFDLVGAASALLTFRISYDDFLGGIDQVVVEVKVDGGAWNTVVTYDSDQGVPDTSGVAKAINLAPYLGEEGVRVRWRYSTVAAFWANYVQIDNVELSCTGGADLTSAAAVDKEQVIEGEEVTLSFSVTNAGPNTGVDVILGGVLPPGFQATSLPEISKGFAVPITPGISYGLVGDLLNGEDAALTIKARAAIAPEVTLDILSPPAIDGNYEAKGAFFGPPVAPNTQITAAVVLVDDGVGTTGDGCEPISNTSELAGKIALLLDSLGSCERDEQVKQAQNGGAIAAIVSDRLLPPFLQGFAPFFLSLQGANFDAMTPSGEVGSPITIPSVLVENATAEALKAQIASNPGVTLTGVPVLSQERELLSFALTDTMDPDFSFFNHNTDNVGIDSIIVLRDTDKDGTADINDDCATDPAKTTPGICGCNLSEADQNGNGFLDCVTTDELGDLTQKASALVKKLKRLSPTGDPKRDKKRRKKQKEIKSALKRLLDEIISTIANPVLPIAVADAGVNLSDLAISARKKGRKATRTGSSKFKQNKAGAKRALKKLKQALA